MGKDTASLLQGPEPEQPGLRVDQGTVETWDADTGDNVVRVAGGQLVNVAALTSESAALAAGDVVLLLWTGQKWVVLGKLITPGDPGTVPTWTADLGALAPLQQVAQNTEGTTISGVTVGTSVADAGRRIEIVEDPDNRINFYSGEDDEVIPAAVNTDGADLHLIAPIYGTITNPTAQVFLRGKRDLDGLEYADATVQARDGAAALSVDDGAGSGAIVSVIGPDAAVAFEVPEGVLIRADSGDPIRIGSLAGELVITDGAIAGADMSDPSNVFPANPQPVQVSNNTALAAISLSTTYAPGSTPCGTTFVAPESGKVKISVGGRIRIETNNNTMYLGFEVRDGDDVGTGSVLPGYGADNGWAVAIGANGTGVTYVFGGGARPRLIEGLTPGETYNVRTMHACQSTTATGSVFNRDLLIEPVL